MTAYDLIRQRCGLSQKEAAAFHDARRDTVNSWCSGRRSAPPGAIAELRALYGAIEKAAAETLTSILAAEGLDRVELGIASDDHEARSLGWPCVGAQAAVLGLVVARSKRPIAIVPRGSTVATAAAADAHDATTAT